MAAQNRDSNNRLQYLSWWGASSRDRSAYCVSVFCVRFWLHQLHSFNSPFWNREVQFLSMVFTGDASTPHPTILANLAYWHVHVRWSTYQTMGKVQKRQSENASRRKSTLINKTYEYGKLYGADVALIIYQNGRYTTYRSVSNPCFPPSMKEIVSSPRTLMGLY